ncbi:putative copper transporter crmD [Aspergillus chevalieri]|uniref:Copper transport protein n=1 Tax=Aspergillus chevalieri TaxID=182096 RepID=A0A7R7ZSY3_ASPCH|nr:uncharacterized protein ACHE_80034S [Aspergillus chevalieri]BCR92134.1 hypothetical protein ACHE_80034S [Aspergillus chevalieri]
MDHSTVNMTMEMKPDHGHGMAMPAFFTTGTHITLLFNSWRTASLTSYLLALLLLFVLAFFNRFLGVLKFQLDAEIQTLVPDVPIIAPPPASRYPSIPKDHMSPLPRYVKNHNAHDDSDHFPPPFSHTHSSEWNDLISGRSVKPQGSNTRFARMLSGLLISRESWTWRRRSLHSLLEGARALIGYTLMLAVMTFNTGVLCAVIGGIVVGELVLGQYAQGPGWQDGVCHDG